MSSQPLPELQLVFLFQVSFAFFLRFASLFPDVLLLIFSHSEFSLHASPFFLIFILVLYGIGVSQLFLPTLFFPIFSFAPCCTGGLWKTSVLPGMVLWLVLALALRGGACRNQWSQILLQISPSVRTAEMRLERLWKAACIIY